MLPTHPIPPDEMLIYTKLHPSRIRTNVLERPQLIQRLQQANTCRLTLISAPAGYGKTTLLSTWLRETGRAAGWISLNEMDSEILVFLSYLAAAMQSINAEAGQRTKGVLASSAPPPIEQMAQIVLSDLVEFEQDTVLVLDDYHRLAADSPVHELLTQIIEYLPATVHLVIATRRDPCLPLLRLKLQGQLAELSAEDLKFSWEELHSFLQQSLDTDVSKPVVTELQSRTAGWPAVVRLALLVMEQQIELGLPVESITGNNALIMEYLMDEVLSNLPPATQRFLWQVSILERCTAALCAAVTELPEAACQQILMELESRNVLITAMEERGDWFYLHQLLRDLLLAQLQIHLGRSECQMLHRQASAWFAEHGHLQEAIQHALAGEDVASSVRLVEQYAHSLLNAERSFELRHLLSLLPDDVVEQHPTLLLTRAWLLHHQDQLAELSALLPSIERLLAQTNPGCDEERASILLGELAALRSMLYYWENQGELSIRQALFALEQLPKHHDYVRGIAILYLAGSYQLTGHVQRAVQTLSQWLQDAPNGARVFQLRGLMAYSFIHILTAELEPAAHAARHMLKLAREHHKSLSIGWAHYLSGLVHYERNELDAAAHHFAAAVELYPGIHMLAMYNSRFRQALVYQAQNQPEKATECIDSLLGLDVPLFKTSLFELLQSFRAHLALLQGNGEMALRWACTVNCSPPLVPMVFEVPLLTQARAFWAHGTPESLQRAEALLQECLQAAQTTHATRRVMETLALQALVYARQARTELAMETLTRSTEIGQRSGFIRTFVDLGPPMADLLSHLVRRGTLSEPMRQYVHKLLAAFPTRNGNHPCGTEVDAEAVARIPEPLTAREMEVLRLLEKRFTNQEIAHQLVISQRTVKKHASNIYQKLNISGRHQAVAQAKALGILASTGSAI